MKTKIRGYKGRGGTIPVMASSTTGVNPGIAGGVAKARGLEMCDTPEAKRVEGENMDRIMKFFKDIIGKGLKEFTRGLWSLIRSIGTGLFQFFRSAPGEYITFIIFIILIFCGIGWLFYSSNSPLRRSGGGGAGSSFTNWLANMNVDTSWLYKIRLGETTDGIPKVTRKLEVSGRCDNINRIELDDKQCLNLDLPQTIEWNIQTKDIPEWDSLPSIVQRKLSENGKKLTIYIPWELEDGKFTPNCSQAYFANGTSAGHLFTDMDGICKKKVLPARLYKPQPLEFEEGENGEAYVVNPMDDDKECQL